MDFGRGDFNSSSSIAMRVPLKMNGVLYLALNGRGVAAIFVASSVGGGFQYL